MIVDGLQGFYIAYVKYVRAGNSQEMQDNTLPQKIMTMALIDGSHVEVCIRHPYGRVHPRFAPDLPGPLY